MIEEHIDNHCDKINDILVEIIKYQKKSFKTLEIVFIATIISLTIIICGMIGCFTWYESQFETTETTRTEITQEVDGENSSINNVSGNQYNDNAIHNEENDYGSKTDGSGY